MNGKSKSWNIAAWILGLIFIALGILNIIFIHPVPGLIYLLISSLYLPPTSARVHKKLGFAIPVLIKIILAVLVLWFTLGVGDLMELFEANYLR